MRGCRSASGNINTKTGWQQSLCEVVKYMPRSAELDAAAQDGIGMRDGTGVRKQLNGKRGLTAKVLHLARENRSPNRDRELSVGELNGRENRSEKVNLIFRLPSHFGARQYLTN